MADCDNHFDGSVNDDDLVLYFYGELPAAQRLRVRTALLDPALRARYDTLCLDLERIGARLDGAATAPGDLADRLWDGIARRTSAARAVAPARSSGSGAPRGDTARPVAWFALAASVLLAIVGIAYDAGQRSVTPASPALVRQDPTPDASDSSAATVAGPAGERVLLAAVHRHLGASERLLIGLANAPAGGVAQDVADGTGMSAEALEAERQWARTLLTANRLYRFAAERAGQDRLSDLLGDLEPVLIELANGSGGQSARLTDAVRQSIATRDLLPRVRAVQTMDGPDAGRRGGTDRKEETT